MPIIEYDTYKQKLGAMGPKLETLAAALDLEGARRRSWRRKPATPISGTTWPRPRRSSSGPSS